MNLAGGRTARRSSPPPGPLSNLVLAIAGAHPAAVRRSRRGDPARRPDRSSRSWTCFVLINIVLMVFNLIPIPPLDGSKVLFAAPRPADRVADPPVPRAVRLPHPHRRLLPPARPLDRQPGPAPRSSTGSMASWWAAKVRQFRSHLRARVSPAERAALAAWSRPAQLALFDSMHVADRRHGLDVVASLRADGVTDPDVLLAGPAPRRRQGRHRRLAAGRLVARPALRAWVWRVAGGCRASARRSSGCGPTPRPRPRSPRRPAARRGPSS